MQRLRIGFGLAALFFAVALGSWAVSAFADTFSDPGGVPRLIPFRGHLESGGAPVTATLTVTVSLYDEATDGTLLWGPEAHTVTPNRGDFTVLLGSTTPLPPTVLAGGDAYVEVTVGATTLTPRQRLGSVAYALRSATAASAESATGALQAALDARLRDTTDTLSGDLTVTGRVLAQGGLRPDYDSGWFAASRAGRYDRAHDLGMQPTRFTVLVSPNATGNPAYVSGWFWQNLENEGGRGVIVTDVTDTSLSVRTGSFGTCALYDTWPTTGFTNRVCLASGYVRVLAWR